MTKLAVYVLALALVLVYVPNTVAEDLKPSAACNPWSANYWGDIRITTQVEADELACFRRVVGRLTLVQASATPIALPKLRGVVGDLHVVFASPQPQHTVSDPRRELEQMLPFLEGVSGRVTLEYIRGESLLPTAAGLSHLKFPSHFAEFADQAALVERPMPALNSGWPRLVT
jgi:hypothetical protein